MEHQSIKENDPKKLTCGKIAEFLNDETKANKEYTSLGLLEIAKDESDHAKLFKKWQKEKKCDSKN